MIDIVQAAGRALRRYPGKDYGYILLPLVVPQKMKFRDFAETTAFRQVARTITALSTQDERIADEFRAIEKGRVSSGKIVEIEGDVPVGTKIRLGDFAEAISTRMWESVARANWRSFEEARAYVHNLKLKSYLDWIKYAKSKKRPPDIPYDPRDVYLTSGWVSWGDWLGTGTVSLRLRQYRSFKKARAFARGLGLNSGTEWREYCKSGKKPADIPAKPDNAYAKDGWAGMGDWLGTGRIADQVQVYLPFAKARVFARGLGLGSTAECVKYTRSGKKPDEIPANPNQTYANAGWVGYGDWLGTRRVAPGRSTSFKKARAFVRKLKLKSSTEWHAYCKSGKKPHDIPTNPDKAYANDGWSGMSDWLGTGRRRSGIGWRPFKDARAFVRGLRLKSTAEWWAYRKSGKKPDDIPVNPHRAYVNDGWSGLGDWLGTGRRRGIGWRQFKDARAFAHSLRLRSSSEWYTYCKSGKKPDDIPAGPNVTYANDGWSGMGDWLGTGTVATLSRQYRSFKNARAFARSRRLRSSSEWYAYCKSGKKPHDIPTKPNRTYANDGWVGYGDWLGTGRRRGIDCRPFKDARAFVRGLRLKSSAEWHAYCKSGKKPDDIPVNLHRAYVNDGWSGLGDWLGK